MSDNKQEEKGLNITGAFEFFCMNCKKIFDPSAIPVVCDCGSYTMGHGTGLGVREKKDEIRK